MHSIKYLIPCEPQVSQVAWSVRSTQVQPNIVVFVPNGLVHGDAVSWCQWDGVVSGEARILHVLSIGLLDFAVTQQ
jgi:hypothetical protein